MPDGLDMVKRLGPAIVDPWYVVDEEDRIVDFNTAFHSLFPRSVGRKLRGMSCREAAVLPPCSGGQCLRKTCAQKGAFRLDEVDAEVGGEKLRLVISAVPVALKPGGQGALIVLRNVTDEARVQEQYQRMMDQARQEKRELEALVQARTRDLLSANDELSRLEREVRRLRRGV